MNAQKETAEDFGKRLLGYAQAGFVASGISMGKDLGLFEAIKQLGVPFTSQRLADETNLRERYVREWLASMVTGEVIDFDPSKNIYCLSLEKINAMKDANFFSCWLTRCLGTYPAVLKAMQKDGPSDFVPWAHADFDSLTQRDRKEWLIDENVNSLIVQVPGLHEKLEKGIEVCDAGCSTALLLRHIATKYPNTKFTGFDVLEKSISLAKAAIEEEKIQNISVYTHDIYNLPEEWNEKFDFVFTAEVVHILPSPHNGVKCLHKIVKNGGSFSLVQYKLNADLESNRSIEYARSLYGINMYYCLPALLHHGKQEFWGTDEMETSIKSIGFSVNAKKPLPGSGKEVHFVCTK